MEISGYRPELNFVDPEKPSRILKTLMKGRNVLNILLLCSGILVLSLPCCTPGSCLDETEAKVKAFLYLNDENEISAADSITVIGLNRDSIIYDNEYNIEHINFPLNPSAESCSFTVSINGITDTITFTYSAYPHFLSKECGYTYYFTVDNPLSTSNIIDKISVTKNNITTFDEENVRLYY